VNRRGGGGGEIGEHGAEAVHHVGKPFQIARVGFEAVVDERAQIGGELERGAVHGIEPQPFAGVGDLVDLVAELARRGVIPPGLGERLPATHQRKTALAQFFARPLRAAERSRVLTVHLHTATPVRQVKSSAPGREIAAFTGV